MMTEKLRYHKLSACWVPKLLIDDHKTKRLSSSLNFLSKYDFEGEEFFNRNFTVDETWVAYVNVETQQQSMQWEHTASSSKPKLFSEESHDYGFLGC